MRLIFLLTTIFYGITAAVIAFTALTTHTALPDNFYYSVIIATISGGVLHIDRTIYNMAVRQQIMQHEETE